MAAFLSLNSSSFTHTLTHFLSRLVPKNKVFIAALVINVFCYLKWLQCLCVRGKLETVSNIVTMNLFLPPLCYFLIWCFALFISCTNPRCPHRSDHTETVTVVFWQNATWHAPLISHTVSCCFLATNEGLYSSKYEFKFFGVTPFLQTAKDCMFTWC